jgi:adenylyltransferase/sulfurtransferase
VAVFNYQQENGDTPVNYRDLFPTPPKDGEILNCAEAGVLGVLPGIIGTMLANETIKLIAGIGQPLINSLLTYNALNNQIYEISLSAKPTTKALIPNTKAAFEAMNYEWLCSSGNTRFEIDVATFNQLKDNREVTIIDVRELNEQPLPTGFDYVKSPLSAFKEKAHSIDNDTIILFCQSGKRSLQAAEWLFDTFGESKKIYSLKGGILNWISHPSTQ